MILFIHRKDLRTHDLAAYDHIATAGAPSLHLFVLDPFLLRGGRQNEYSGRTFLRYLNRMVRLYREAGRPLHVLFGEPEQVLARTLELHPDIREVLWHREWTPYARHRDRKLRQTAALRGVSVTELADSMLIDPGDFQRYAGRSGPYRVFTPFYRKWHEYLGQFYRPSWQARLEELNALPADPALAESFPLPWEPAAFGEPAREPDWELDRFLDERLAAYGGMRDRFAVPGTSGLSAAVNTGALSVRQAYEAASSSPVGESWVRQLAWRDFYLYQALYDPEFFSYEERFDLSELSDRHLEAWAKGATGIPLIDAAMTELRETGALHNRLRMITAMFLTKNLLCPFPLGEQVFRRRLADYDNVLNRGGWLWSASMGFDPAPYFRIMNPVSQSQTHDPTGEYIRRWLPHLKHLGDREIHLPQPAAIVDLKASRARAIEVYKGLLASGTSRPDKPSVEKP
ncbi:cryptochrome/photolyase family protein [Gorillibacterium sp. sgz5001074]|uniref:cryptochrome/photolyase family protein n=1 Tax=Gorillibacterium sp. sgz5001074 TaxID=3446695 RepID=UPI003F66827C